MNWYTLYDTATGALVGHTSVLPEANPAWTVIDHGDVRQDQDNVWDVPTRTWVPRPPDPPGPMVDTFTFNGAQAVTWTNMPAALTALPGSVVRVPLVGVTRGRLQANVRVAGFAGATLLVQVSSDNVNWVDGPSVPIGATGWFSSGVLDIPEQYRGDDMYLRLAGQGGNGTVDPQFGLIAFQVGE